MEKPGNYIFKNFSRKLVAKRYERNLTQEKLSELVDIHVVTIQALERGVRNPSFATAIKLSKVLDIPIAELAEACLEELEI